jgi:hypothetical protein
MPKPYEGGCLCGRIRFRAVGEPQRPHTCSCTMCQRHSGAITLHWVEFPAEAVTWTGEGGKPALWRSSEGSSRAFCPICGGTIGAIDDKPVIALAVGAFDGRNRAALAPDYQSYAGQKPAWAKREAS